MKSCFFKSFISILLVIPMSVFAELPWQHDQHTRYLALGDSLTAGYGADPVTNGYAHILYQGGTFDRPVNTLFANAAVPGVTSEDVLNFQLPQVHRFAPDVITMTVGGNDILAVLAGADPEQVLTTFGMNLFNILATLCQASPGTDVYLGNLYDISLPVPGTTELIQAYNMTVDMTVTLVAGMGCPVKVADVYTAFNGRSGLLNINRQGADMFEVHPTNAGYRVMADAFKQVIQ